MLFTFNVFSLGFKFTLNIKKYCFINNGKLKESTS